MGQTTDITTGVSSYSSGTINGVAYDDNDTTMELNADDSVDANAEIEVAKAQIEQTRAEMSDTINAIKERLSPQTLMAEAQEAVAEKAKEKVEDIKDAVKDKVSAVAHGASDIAHNIVASVSHAAESLKDKAVETFGGGDSHTDTVSVTETYNNHAALTTGAPSTVSSVSSAASRNAKRAGDILMQTVKENPIPAVLAGVGLGWLLVDALMKQQHRSHATLPNGVNRYSGEAYADAGYASASGASYGVYQSNSNNFATAGNQPYTENGVQNKLSEAGSKVSDALSSAKDKVGDVAQNLQAKASDTAHTVQEKASDAAHAVQSKASDAAHAVQAKASDAAHLVQAKAGDLSHAAQSTAQQAMSGTQRFIEDNPIAAATIALVVGAVIGLSMPATEPENRYLGEHRDRLADQATDAAKDMLGKVQNVAGEAINTAKTAIVEAKDTVKDTVKETVQTQAREQGLVAA